MLTLAVESIEPAEIASALTDFAIAWSPTGVIFLAAPAVAAAACWKPDVFLSLPVGPPPSACNFFNSLVAEKI